MALLRRRREEGKEREKKREGTRLFEKTKEGRMKGICETSKHKLKRWRRRRNCCLVE